MDKDNVDILENQPDEVVETQETEAKTDANKEVSSPSKGSDDSNSGSSPAKAVEEPEPWHKSPAWKKREATWEKRLGEMQNKYEEVLRNQARFNVPDKGQGTQLSQEDRQSIIKLAQFIKEVPEAAEMLGISRSEALQQQLQGMQTQRSEEAFNTELDSCVSEYSSKYGVKADELKEQFAEFLEDNPFYASKDYSKGVVKAAFKTMLFDRQDELAERKVNLKLIQDKKQKQNGVEPVSKGAVSKNGVKPKNLSDHLDSLIRENGGEIDFG